jgi:hypothetical protein
VPPVDIVVVATCNDEVAGYARFPAHGGAVGRTGLDGRPVPVEQADGAGPVLRLLAGQLIEPFQAQG